MCSAGRLRKKCPFITSLKHELADAGAIYLLCTLCLIRSTYLFVVLEQEDTMGKVIE
jgi:hypothetical protein